MAAGVDGTGGISDEALVELVDKMTEERFLDFIDDFVDQHAERLQPDGSGEFSHRCLEVHQQYQRLFEARVEAWLRQRGYSFMDFIVTAQNSDSLAADVAQELLAVSDFGVFTRMMGARRGAAAGDPAAPAAPPLAGPGSAGTLAVQIPDGVCAGQAMQVETPAGPMAVVVPFGLGPGMWMQVQLGPTG